MAQKKYKAGSVAKADVLKADTTLASREVLALERARNNREIAKGTLLSKLSFPADQNIEIQDMGSNSGNLRKTKALNELIGGGKNYAPRPCCGRRRNKDAAWHRRNSAFF